ncbi:unnamed protein product [Effrenium voratum]|nr:unnamed protein product [Effrenium voratum]
MEFPGLRGRYFMDRTISLTGPEGEAFWRQVAGELPEDPEMLVTGEEVASAMLAWLEQLVGEGPGDEEDSADDDEDEPEREAPALTPEAQAMARRLNPPLAVPAAPTGPPPQRKVQRPSLVRETFERGLSGLLAKSEARPTQPTKETVAEWREVIEFQVSLARWMKSVSKEDLDLAKFHTFAKCHFGKLSARRRSSASPRKQGRQLREKAALVLKSRLQGMLARRLSESFCTWRSQQVSFKPSRNVGDVQRSSILKELLKSQCQTAVMLETRVRLSHRAGGLAFCLAKLQRKTLRTAWVQLGRYQGHQMLPSPPPLLTAGGLGSINAQQQLYSAFIPATNPSLMAPPRRLVPRRAGTTPL